MKVAIVFPQFGPYHHARVRSLQKLAPFEVVPVQIAADTSTYQWVEEGETCTGLVTLLEGTVEQVSPVEVYRKAVRLFKQYEIKVALLPSYAPGTSTALFAAAKRAGLKTVMMNESHAGTEQATGWKRWIKRRIVRQFDAALVGGTPHQRHFANLGLPPEKILSGYDAVDNRYFETATARVLKEAGLIRAQFRLPPEYFLSLGRFVTKKNLQVLLYAYSKYIEAYQHLLPVKSLVFVGSGPEEESLKNLCRELSLHVVDQPPASTASQEFGCVANSNPDSGHPAVYFMGFRQIQENPVFYALAAAFVLPSLWEEWGLVVNEAMACGLPVIVSRTAGCAEDLVEDGCNGYLFDPHSPSELVGHLHSITAEPEKALQMGRRSIEIISRWGCDNFAKHAIQSVNLAVLSRKNQRSHALPEN